MRKRLAATLLTCSMVAMALAGCGGSESAETSAAAKTEVAKTAAAVEVTAETTVAASEEVKWPTGPVTVYIPANPGNPLDLSSRILLEYLSKETGQTFVPTNEPTGSGVLAEEMAMSAEPDGQTLLINGVGSAIMYHTGSSDIDFMNPDQSTIIAYGCGSSREYGSLLCAAAEEPYDTFQEFIDYATANPGKVLYGTTSVGTGELKNKLLLDHYNLDVNLLYANSNELITNMLGGRIDVAMLSPLNAAQYIENGDMKPLIMDLAEDYKGDDPMLQKVETYNDYGIENLVFNVTGYIAGPAGMDPALVHKINETINNMQNSPEYMEQLTALNFKLYPYSVEETIKVNQVAVDQIKAIYGDRNQ